MRQKTPQTNPTKTPPKNHLSYSMIHVRYSLPTLTVKKSPIHLDKYSIPMDP